MFDNYYSINLRIAWLGILLGLIAGGVIGLFFHEAKWLGGYASWSRRMLRLGHISFVGIALLNIAFVATLPNLRSDQPLWIPSLCFAGAELTMPLVCFLSAAWKDSRYLFPIPVFCLLVGCITVLLWGE